eukprot:1149118-Pelagomonas_calceolata.AAC.2
MRASPLQKNDTGTQVQRNQGSVMCMCGRRNVKLGSVFSVPLDVSKKVEECGFPELIRITMGCFCRFVWAKRDLTHDIARDVVKMGVKESLKSKAAARKQGQLQVGCSIAQVQDSIANGMLDCRVYCRWDVFISGSILRDWCLVDSGYTVETRRLFACNSPLLTCLATFHAVCLAGIAAACEPAWERSGKINEDVPERLDKLLDHDHSTAFDRLTTTYLIEAYYLFLQMHTHLMHTSSIPNTDLHLAAAADAGGRQDLVHA